MLPLNTHTSNSLLGTHVKSASLITSKLRQNTQHLLHKEAIIVGKNTKTYGELWQKVADLQEHFASYKIQKGEVIAICSPNNYELCYLFLAALEYGAIPFIVNYRLNYDNFFSTLPIRHYFIVKNQLKVISRFIPDNFINQTFDDAFQLYVNPQVPYKMLENTALLATSSGTKGTPKIVSLTANGTLKNIEGNIKAIGIRTEDKTAITLPMGYSYGLIGQFLSHLYAGATIVIVDTIFFFSEISNLLEKQKVSSLFLVPPMVRQINYLYKKGMIRINTHSLRYITVGGNRIEDIALKRIMGILNCSVIKTYGLAEAGPRVATYRINPQSYDVLDSVGMPNMHVRVEIVDGRNQPLPKGAYGRIKVYSPSVMAGYFGFHHGSAIKPLTSVLTKDYGFIDTKGRIVITGRKGDSFQLNRQTFWYKQVENLLYENFYFLKISLQKNRQKVFIKAITMYDQKVNPAEVMKVLVDHYGQKASRKFEVEICYTNEVINEK